MASLRGSSGAGGGRGAVAALGGDGESGGGAALGGAGGGPPASQYGNGLGGGGPGGEPGGRLREEEEDDEEEELLLEAAGGGAGGGGAGLAGGRGGGGGPRGGALSSAAAASAALQPRAGQAGGGVAAALHRPHSEELEEEAGLGESDPGDSAIEDPELEAIKARVREMEEEAEKLKELQNEVEKQMNMSPPPGNAGPVIMSLEEKIEADARSIYVGNVDYGATAEELEAHFHGCGSVNRVTILCDKYTGHPKGFAYIEFSDKESVRTSLALDESLFRGRQIKVIPKRTNRPGISTTDRGFPRTRYRGRGSGYSSSRARFYSGFSSRPPRGRAYRGRARSTSWYSPY
ncbi:polyadenylate-binding protein 2 [Eublepharis macularius]|uniref:Polyadenylate-binding protein 2 n=1 Tax=Eublepharis macularius TaxID=481883 RepID=A0AA97K9N7_EUBMA|nr:polyadenylate-binding protein 2 [Eublepharis macularius]